MSHYEKENRSSPLDGNAPDQCRVTVNRGRQPPHDRLPGWIYAAATDLITRYRLNALDIDRGARGPLLPSDHLPPLLRSARPDRDVVLTRAAARIADGVRSDVPKLCGGGSGRRGDPVIASADPIPTRWASSCSARSHGGAGEVAWLTESPLRGFTELTGIAGGDPQGAESLVRAWCSTDVLAS